LANAPVWLVAKERSGQDMKPFLKWVGSKRASAEKIISHFPKEWNPEKSLYIEPFLGSGAVFFALQPKRAVLNDMNTRLIRTFRGVRDAVEGVIDCLQAHEINHKQSGLSYYLQIRDSLNLKKAFSIDLPLFAADFIFLNKAGFNGLYRVNSKDEINVPWGKDKERRICNAENLRLCSTILQAASLPDSFNGLDMHNIYLKDSLNGSVIYCDPPYVPISKTSCFTGYTSTGFDYKDQLELVSAAVKWRDLGAHVILSQAVDALLIEQYRRCGFTTELIKVNRSVNSKGSARGSVNEYIIF
jgi:DNA adenine methylase